LKSLNVRVLVRSSLLHDDSVGTLGHRLVPEGHIDAVRTVVGRGIVDVIGSIVFVDNLSRDLFSIGAGDLDLIRIASSAHLVAVAIHRLDVEGGWLSVINIFQTLAPHQRCACVRSRDDLDSVRTVFDVIVVQRDFSSENDVDIVGARIGGLVNDAIRAILVVCDRGGDFFSSGPRDLNIDRMATVVDSITSSVFGDDRELAWVCRVSSLDTSSKNVKLRWVRIIFSSCDLDVERRVDDVGTEEGDGNDMFSRHGWLVNNLIEPIVAVGHLVIDQLGVRSHDFHFERISSRFHLVTDSVAGLDGEVGRLVDDIAWLQAWAEGRASRCIRP